MTRTMYRERPHPDEGQPVYTAEGKGYFVQCTSAGNVVLFEGATGTECKFISLGSNIEASPAIFENTIVVGTRGQKVFGITIE